MALEGTSDFRAILRVFPKLGPSGYVAIWGARQEDPEICILFLNRNLCAPRGPSWGLGLL